MMSLSANDVASLIKEAFLTSFKKLFYYNLAFRQNGEKLPSFFAKQNISLCEAGLRSEVANAVKFFTS